MGEPQPAAVRGGGRSGGGRCGRRLARAAPAAWVTSGGPRGRGAWRAPAASRAGARRVAPRRAPGGSRPLGRHRLALGRRGPG
eukprot:6236558-Lingulodinium_polyedra.AAC.1